MKNNKSTLVRFFEKIELIPEHSCWEWTAGKTPAGYGIFHPEKYSSVYAHRYMFEHKKGPISKGHFICHSCDNPGCVNPDHLFSGTCKENLEDMVKKNRHFWKKRTHCSKGHELTPDNLKPYELKFGARQCKICDRAYSRKHYRKSKRDKTRPVTINKTPT